MVRPSLPQRPPPFPNVWQAVVLTLILLGAQGIGGFVIATLQMILSGAPTMSVYAGMLGAVNLVSFGVVLIIGVLWGRLSLRQTLALRGFPIVLLLPMTLTVLGLSVLLSELSNLVLLLMPPPDFIIDLFQGLADEEGQGWQNVLLLSVVAPITEEPVFRGLLLAGVLLHRRRGTAIAITSLLFAAMHLNPWQFGPALALGVLLGWWFVRTRSLWPCIFGHALNNSLPQILVRVPGLDIPGYTTTSVDTVFFQPMWFNLLGLTLFVTGVLWARRQFSRMPAPPIARALSIPMAVPLHLSDQAETRPPAPGAAGASTATSIANGSSG